MNVGADIGYSAVKVISATERFDFPSVVGTPQRSHFSFNGTASSDIYLTLPDGSTWLVGQGAVEQSRFAPRPEDKDWIITPTYRRLMLAAFTGLTSATSCDLSVVTGLPVAFYESDKGRLRDLFLGEHRAGREGRRQQLFRVTDCRVIPQPFGALLAHTLDDRGRVADQDMLTGTVGIIDVGGKTTNLLSVSRLRDIAKETASVNVGAWDAAREVNEYLTTECPGLDLRDHQVIEAMIRRDVVYFGETLDLGTVIDSTLEPMAEEVIARATQLWNGGASLKMILVSGGGAHLLGSHIRRRFRHARVVADPVFANATGYYRFRQYLGKS